MSRMDLFRDCLLGGNQPEGAWELLAVVGVWIRRDC